MFLFNSSSHSASDVTAFFKMDTSEKESSPGTPPQRSYPLQNYPQPSYEPPPQPFAEPSFSQAQVNMLSEEQPKQTPYMIMSIQANQARRRYTVSAGIFNWLTLAGYLVLPPTFTSLQSSNALSGSVGGQILQNTVQNVQLLPLAGILCLIGTAGTSWLWYKWRKNYVWLITYIFV